MALLWLPGRKQTRRVTWYRTGDERDGSNEESRKMIRLKQIKQSKEAAYIMNRKIVCSLLALALAVFVLVLFVVRMAGRSGNAGTSEVSETSVASGIPEASGTSGTSEEPGVPENGGTPEEAGMQGNGGTPEESGTAETPEYAQQFLTMDKDCGACAMVADKDGTFLVVDQYNRVIWRVRNGAAEQYAGMVTKPDRYGRPLGGYADGRPEESVFGLPWAIAPFLDGWAVSDASNNAVRLIRETGVETINGRTDENMSVTEAGVAFDYPTGLAADDQGNLYVSDTHNGAVRKLSKEGLVTTVADNLEDPMGLFWSDGTLYIAETGANRIVTLAQDGQLKTLAGSGESGCKDGNAVEAWFSCPQWVTAGPDGTLYVADTGNGAVRCISGGQVTTLKTEERMFSPAGLMVQDNTLFICDSFARRILQVELEEK